MRVYRNKVYLLLIILLSVILTSCQTSKVKQGNKVHLEEKIISTKADAGTEFLDAAVSEGSAYLISNSNMIQYDMASGEKTVVKEATGNTVICTDKDFIYTYNQEQNAVIKFGKEGKVKETYPCTFDQIEATRMCIYNDTIIIAAFIKDGTEVIGSELYKLDLTSGKSSKIPDNFKGNDSFAFILGLDFVDKNTIMISSAANTNFMNIIVKGYRYDLQKEKVLDEFFLPYSNSYTYDAENQCFYFNNIGSYEWVGGKDKLNIRGYYPETSANILFKSMDQMSLGSSGISEHFFSINKMFYYSDNVISWSKSNDCFIITNLTSDKEPLKLITSDRTKSGFMYPLIIDQFEAEYGYPVQIIEYPADVYNEKLRTKLLAGDSDFDIFFLNSPTKDNLLASILNHDLYEPLDNYTDIVNNFSQMYNGISTMMSNKDKLFGVPYGIRASSLVVEDDFNQYGYTVPGKHWTYDDLWSLCEEIVKSGERNASIVLDTTNLIVNYVQDAINQNNLDKAALTDLLKAIIKYNAAGISFEYNNLRTGGGESRYLISPNYAILNSLLEDNNIPDYPEYGTISFPSYSSKSYINLDGCVFINKFSENKEVAADFLAVMTKSENIYNTNIYRFVMLGSDLTQYDKYREWSEKKRSYLSDLTFIYENGGVYTCDIEALQIYIIENVISGLYDESISAEKAAEMIYDRINYTYFE